MIKILKMNNIVEVKNMVQLIICTMTCCTHDNKTNNCKKKVNIYIYS